MYHEESFMKKSMIDNAFDILSSEKKPMSFLSLWQIVAKEMGYTPSQADDNIAQFYSDLSCDGRFTSLSENRWDLRTRQTSANSIVNPELISVEDEEDYPVEEEELPIETVDESDSEDE